MKLNKMISKTALFVGMGMALSACNENEKFSEYALNNIAYTPDSSTLVVTYAHNNTPQKNDTLFLKPVSEDKFIEQRNDSSMVAVKLFDFHVSKEDAAKGIRIFSNTESKIKYFAVNQNSEIDFSSVKNTINGAKSGKNTVFQDVLYAQKVKQSLAPQF